MLYNIIIYINCDMPRKTKKQQELEKLKDEYFDENDKLKTILIHNKRDELIYEYSYVPNKTKVYKIYYEDNDGNVINKEAYESLDVKSKKKELIACEVNDDDKMLMECMEHLRIGVDTSKIKIEYKD